MKERSREADRFLRGYKRAEDDYKNAKKWIRHLTEDEDFVRSLRYGDTARGAKNETKDLSDYSVYIREQIDEFERKAKAAREKQLEIENAIKSLEDENERRVLSMFYIDGVPWRRIPAKLNYSINSVYRFRRLGWEHIRISES